MSLLQLQSRFASITAEASSELLRKNLGTLYAFAAIVAYNLKVSWPLVGTLGK